MMDQQPLLSVIVPCYNVEKYLDKCISSIVSQTYINLEILLIDDGSTDNSGMICDAWQERDKRIQVIHKQNEGSSYARKTGVEHVTADYITFVDADDWIDEDMYLNMMTALISTHSDIAQCGFCYAFEDGSIKRRSFENRNGSFEIFDRMKSVSLILEDKEWGSYMWNKIFKKHLFEHIEFPKGRALFEDLAIVHILFHHASQTVYLRDDYYFYLQRIGSISRSKHIYDNKMKNLNDAYISVYERYCFIEQHPEYHSNIIFAKNCAIFYGMQVLRYSMMYPYFFPKDNCHWVEKQLHTIGLGFTQKDMMKRFFRPSMRVQAFIFFRCPACYKMLIKILNTRILKKIILSLHLHVRCVIKFLRLPH